MSEATEAADRLEEIKEEIAELLDEALGIVKDARGRDEWDRCRRTWGSSIETALSRDHDWLGGCTNTMMDAANFVFDHARGPVYGWFSSEGLRALVLPAGTSRSHRLNVLHDSVNDRRGQALHAALGRFFAGVRETFADVALDLEGATPFRRLVWETARAVPWGSTESYGDLAHRIGKPKAARAVGQALGANPIPIVIPCHRFIAGDGSLGGFGAGLEWKRELLRLEGVAL